MGSGFNLLNLGVSARLALAAAASALVWLAVWWALAR
jgi:hypothetical protein